MRKRKLLLICIVTIIISFLSGCSQIDTAKVKLGLKNNDFEYIKQGKVKQIVIQNQRDSGYKFVVTSSAAISELYDILSDAKQVDNKSALQPDYTFSLYENDKIVHKFNYIVGLDSKEAGNLFSDSKCYIVPSRIDSSIINNFNDQRTPKDFNKLYYNFIIKCINKYRKDTKNNTKSVLVDLNDDVDVQKYIFSTDLDQFQRDLPSNTQYMSSQSQTADITETVVTTGFKYGSFKYKSAKSSIGYIYRCTVTFEDNSTKEQKKYYVVGTYLSDDDGWNIDISDKAVQ